MMQFFRTREVLGEEKLLKMVMAKFRIFVWGNSRICQNGYILVQY